MAFTCPWVTNTRSTEGGAMTVETSRLECQAVVIFEGSGEATCPGCGVCMFLNGAGQIGRPLTLFVGPDQA